MRNYRQLVLGLSCLLALAGCSKLSKFVLPQADKHTVTIYFTKANDELGVVLIPVKRKVLEGRTPYETAFRELFLGPTAIEQEKFQLNTEIPNGSRLINIKEDDKEVNLNISSQFMAGGGSESMQVRFRQLRETALNLAKGRPVYLNIDGQRAKSIGGEGLEIPQPLDN